MHYYVVSNNSTKHFVTAIFLHIEANVYYPHNNYLQGSTLCYTLKGRVHEQFRDNSLELQSQMFQVAHNMASNQANLTPSQAPLLYQASISPNQNLSCTFSGYCNCYMVCKSLMHFQFLAYVQDMTACRGQGGLGLLWRIV